MCVCVTVSLTFLFVFMYSYFHFFSCLFLFIYISLLPFFRVCVFHSLELERFCLYTHSHHWCAPTNGA